MPGRIDALPRLLGARIAELRRERHLTQQDLSDRCGYGMRYLQRLEREGINVKLSTLATIAAALGVEPCELLRAPREITEPRRGRPRKPR